MKQTAGNRKTVFFVSFVLCALAYSVLIANECTNVWDGLWMGSQDGGFRWVIQIGRWLWPLIGWSRMLISSEPAASLIAIALFVLSGCLMLSALSLRDGAAAYLAPLSLGVNATVCMSLSYRFMSPTFGTAVLLNVLGVWLLKTRERWWGWALAAICFTLGLGAYQAYLGCALVLFLACVIQMLLRQEEKKHIVSFALRMVTAVLAACVAYKILWDAALALTHLEPAAYRGANQISVGGILTHLPQRITDAYADFFRYFTRAAFPHNAFQNTPLYPAAAGLFALFALLPAVRHFRVSKPGAAAAFICFLLFPLAANVSLLLAPDAGNTDVLMALPTVMLLPALLCVSCQNERKSRVLRWAPLLLAGFLLYGGFLQASVDQHAMLRGKESTLSLMNRVVGNLEERNLIQQEHEIVFLGQPSNHPLFQKDALWEQANVRSRYGALPYAGDACVMSYRGVARDAGYSLPLAEDAAVWHEMEARPECRAMPVYPAEGYCQIIDGYLVVKLSD